MNNISRCLIWTSCALGSAIASPALARPQTKTTPVLGITKPDLTVTGVVFEGGLFAGPCNRVVATIRNLGSPMSSTAVPVQLRQVQDGRQPGTTSSKSVSGLAAGATTQVVFDPQTVTAGVSSLAISVTVDPANAVAEGLETNNTFNVPATTVSSIKACPKLSISDAPEVVLPSAVNFNVTTDRSFPRPITVRYATSGGGAKCSTPPVIPGIGSTSTNSSWYVATSGTLTFAAGTVGPQRISVSTCGTIESPDFTPDTGAKNSFDVRLSSPTNATLSDPVGVAVVIVDFAEVPVPLGP